MENTLTVHNIKAACRCRGLRIIGNNSDVIVTDAKSNVFKRTEKPTYFDQLYYEKANVNRN